jgi:uncharacterized protein YbbC (DUF1343 family)/CubicO group peptidase (beta-lactamase class C family)
MKKWIPAVCAVLAVCLPLAAQEVPAFASAADQAIQEAVANESIPGAVLLVGHGGKVVYHKAYGSRALVPAREKMTEDTIFDLASLTKVVATTPSIMKLFEQGKIRMDDRVTDYLPTFQGGRTNITVRDLLTHFSGLRPDLDLKPEWSGYDTGIKKALADPPAGPPGVKFVYSDINFILLGEIVHRLSGEPLDQFAKEQIFEPLGMKDTGFRPAPSLRPRIAPTEIDPHTGKPLRGVVHDPTSRFMGGVAGHAGLFSTASDLALYAQMMLDQGRAAGRQLFSPVAVQKFTSPETPPGQPILRGFGWDIDSPFSSNRGELFPIGSFGHTGFTGTDIWIDPSSQTYVILLTNAVHPRGGKSIRSMRARVATLVAAAYGSAIPGIELTGYDDFSTSERRTVARNTEVWNGLDVLARDQFAPLKGRHIGLITNHTGLSRDGKRNIDLMRAAGIDITAIFSPEHGLAGTEDREDIGNGRDTATGIPVFSLYDGKDRRPTGAMLKGVDTLVFDIQDVGARFYTYSCTMIYSLREAARRKIPFYVLDRPNPITGVHVEGPVLASSLESFVGCAAIPVRHGMTLGELARMVNGEDHLGADLHVIAAEGWHRGDWFDSTGLTWVDPSPNMLSLNAALLYPGIALLEASANYSVGRGTGAPFEQVGATWIRGAELAKFLNSRYITGIRVYPTRFQPTASKGKGEWMSGVRFVITDRDNFDSVGFGLELAYALEQLYPGKIDWKANERLIGSDQVIAELKAGSTPSTIMQKYRERLDEFVNTRAKYLLYPGR